MSEFIKVCAIEDLIKDAGIAALVEGIQVALFYVDDQVYALNNEDPIRKANVMSRGMTGDRGGVLTVASPLHKEHYSLVSGECLDVEGVTLDTYETKLEAGMVWVRV